MRIPLGAVQGILDENTITPGAIYNLKPSVGFKQPDGSKTDPPIWGFSKGRRFPHSAADPGPGQRDRCMTPGKYTLPALVGQQPRAGYSSRVRCEPHYGFGTSTRDGIAKASAVVPGKGMETVPVAYSTQGGLSKTSYSMQSKHYMPDGSATLEGGTQYDPPPSMGVQADSRKPAAPMPKFGTATRDQLAKLAQAPAIGPGPHSSYKLDAGIGHQASSRKRTGAKTVFSRAERFPGLKMSNVPGPGKYDY